MTTAQSTKQPPTYNSSADHIYRRPRAKMRRHRERLGRAIRQGDCWVWTGSISPSGYGVTRVGAQNMPAHRWMYEQFAGPIPAGLQLDHVCRNTRCVAPYHLEPVTAQENTRRALAVRDRGAHREICSRGHEMTPENTYVRTGKSQPGSRECRACGRARANRRNAERKAMREDF